MNANNTPKTSRLAKRKASFVWILLLSLFLLSFSSNRAIAQSDAKQHVLILNSYHQGFSWTNRIIAGIDEVFNNADLAIETHIEYMDTKRLLNETHLENLYELYKDKYATIPIDLIIVSDNNGLEFLRTYGEDLFPGTPIVFTGINNFSDDLLNGFDQITGVAEETDIAATLELMLNLHPNTEQIYLLNDKTPTGVATLESFEEVRPQFEDQVEFVIFDDFAVTEMQQELASLPANSLILMLLVNQDNTGQFYTYEESLTLLSQNTQAPIYGIWDFYIGYGIVGGKLTNGNSQGRAAAEIALRILQGESAADIPVVRDSPNQYMFDYELLQQFSIDSEQLPEDSLILNRAPTFYELYKTYIWIAAAVFIILTVAVIVLLINIAQRQRVEKELQQSYARRGRQVELSTQVAQEITGIKDLDELYQNIVHQVKDQFGYYHTQILQYDPEIDAVRLIAGYGDTGAQMLAEEHLLDMGQGLIGQAAATGETIMRSTLANDPDWKPNPLLPETKGEIAVPIKLGTEILGVLDVQSDEPGALNADDQLLLEGLCGQIAIAIENARQYEETQRSQDAIQERETLLRTIIDSTPDWIFVKDHEHRYLVANKEFANTLGMTPDKIVGKNDLEVGIPEEVVEGVIWPAERQVMDSGEMAIVEEETTLTTGKHVFLITTRVPLLDADNKVSGFVGFVHDNTERLRAEEAVRERETLLRTIIDSTPDWIFVKDVEHRYMMVNKGYADSFQIEPKDFIGKNDLEIGFPEEIVKGDPEKGIRGFWVDDREIMERGELKIIDEEPAVVGGEERFLHTIKAPLKDEQGSVTGIVGFVHDITNRKQIEAELQEAQQRTQEILESITVPMVVSRIGDGTVAYVNEPMAEVIRVSREELIGQVTPDFYHDPTDRQSYLTALRERGEVMNYDLRLKRGDGELFWALISGRIINFEGKPAVITSVIDITERREAQATIVRRATELETVAEVGTVAATILEPDELLQQVVELTKERFNLYHAHVYLLDAGTEELILTNGAGEVGHTMVAEGRRIALSQEKSLVARAAREQKGVVINDVEAEPGFLPHPLLPDTRAEMAVPLIVRSEVLGVLDVQGDVVNRFTAEDINIFTTLAAQIAVALQNAQSLSESERAVEELRELSRRLAREGWETYLAERAETLSFGYDRQQKSRVMQLTTSVQDANLLTQPLQIQGEPIGRLLLEPTEQYGEDESELLTAVTERLTAHLENLRLAEASEKDRAAAEKRSQEMGVINNIVTQISTSLDLQHSLQIVVDELATAVNVDQVRVALIQPGKKEMLVIAEHYDSSRATSAVGMAIPIEGNELTQNVIKTRQLAIVEDAQNDPQTAPVHDLFREQGIETVILMPLVVNDEVIGTLGMDILDKRTISEESLKLAETIVFQTATAIQNARLFEQIQATLAETEMLYSYSSQLNTATSLDAVLGSAAEAGLQVGAAGAMLLVYDRNTTGNPEYAQIAATVPHDEAQVGQRINLQEQPGRYLWPTSGQNTVFVGDIAADDRLSPEDKEALGQLGIQAMAIMFLSVGNLRLGQILIHWNKAQTFTNADERLYGAIAQQASSVVYNRLLFNQTEEALSETAALYQASADLNTAQTFDEVLTALRQHTVLGQGSGIVAINYFNHVWDKGDMPEFVDVLARWTAKPVEIPRRHELATFPEADVLLQPHDMLVSNDIAADSRIGEETKQYFDQLFGAKSMIFVPLLVGNQWVGFVNGLYPQTMNFSEEQLRRLNVLVRQAAVTIQSIRLYEQTQEALAQTEALYTGSERIVLASTEDDILQSLIVSTELRRLDRASLFMFDRPVEDRVPGDVTVVATWVNEGVPPSVQVGTRFEVARVPFLSTVNPDESLVINDIRNDPRVDAQTRQILESYGMISFVMIPIVVGSQWLGMISGQSAEPMNMTDVQMRQANSLVGQAAVVMQTTILFRQEQARARREHLLREIAAKVRNSTDIDTIMQTAVTEIGRTLGRRSFIKLGDGQNGNARAGTGPLSQRQNENENGAT